MSVLARRLRNGNLVYWVVFTWQGKQTWERSGPDQRTAIRLRDQRKREVKEGTYVPPERRKATTFGQYARTWAENRTNRNANDELKAIEKYVLTQDWLTSLPLDEVRAGHVFRLVTALKSTVSEATKKPLSPKTVANIFGTVRTMFRDARLAELTTADPCVLPRGTFSRRTRKRRMPYILPEMRALMSEALEPDARMFNALAFFTGMREGEVCGRRWRDYDPGTEPLGSLHIQTQYDDRMLKSEEAGGEQPRVAPVHGELAKMLAWWRAEGFELVYCRKPTNDDFIVPHRDDKGARPHTKSTAYKMWRRSCLAVGVNNHSLHSTRHTFISMCRRGGAPKDVIERITHNACGDIIDGYTFWDWEPLCAAVEVLTQVLIDITKALKTSGGAGNRRLGGLSINRELPGILRPKRPNRRPQNSAEFQITMPSAARVNNRSPSMRSEVISLRSCPFGTRSTLGNSRLREVIRERRDGPRSERAA